MVAFQCWHMQESAVVSWTLTNCYSLLGWCRAIDMPHNVKDMHMYVLRTKAIRWLTITMPIDQTHGHHTTMLTTIMVKWICLCSPAYIYIIITTSAHGDWGLESRFQLVVIYDLASPLNVLYIYSISLPFTLYAVYCSCTPSTYTSIFVSLASCIFIADYTINCIKSPIHACITYILCVKTRNVHCMCIYIIWWSLNSVPNRNVFGWIFITIILTQAIFVYAVEAFLKSEMHTHAARMLFDAIFGQELYHMLAHNNYTRTPVGFMRDQLIFSPVYDRVLIYVILLRLHSMHAIKSFGRFMTNRLVK